MSTFRVPAFSLKLSDSSQVEDKVQLFRVGTFYHTEYGKFDITLEILKSMEANFKAGVRGIDIAVDYMHDNEAQAAGWIKNLTLSQDGTELWADVDWTPPARKILSDKEFRYLSPEFTFQYQDNESLKTYGPTLLGAGLTNRPTIKKMDPVVNLSEYTAADAQSENDKLKAAQEERSKKYGIQITADGALTTPAGQPTDDAQYGDPVNYKFPMADASQAGNARVRFKQFATQVYTDASSRNKVHERIVKRELELGVKPDFDPKDPLDAGLSADLKSQLGNKKGIKAMDYKTLDPAQVDQMTPEQIKAALLAVLGEMKSQSASMAEMQKAAACSEKKAEFAVMLSDGKACKAQEEAYIAGDMKKFAELAAPGKTNTTASGSGAAAAAGSQTITASSKEEAEKEILKLAEVKLSEKKAKNLSDAMRQALVENPELKKQIYA